MKIRIKTYNGELPSYLTLGKVYDFKEWGLGIGGLIKTDDNYEIHVQMLNCDDLNGGSWEVVNE